MATKDREGFIHYTPEELRRIPPFEVRDRGGHQPAFGLAGVLGPFAGAIIGAGVGSLFGPAGTTIGGITGAVAGLRSPAGAGGGEQRSPDQPHR